MKKRFFLCLCGCLLFSCATTERLVLGENAEEKRGVIDKSGKWIIPPEYDSIYPVDNSKYFIAVNEEKVAHLFDSDGKLLRKEHGIGKQGKYFIICSLDGKCGVLDEHFTMIVPFDFEGVAYISGTKFIVVKDKTLFFFSDGILGPKLNIEMPPDITYLSVKYLNENLVEVLYGSEKGWKNVYINDHGETVSPPPRENKTPPLRDGLRRKSIVIKNIAKTHKGLTDATVWGYVNEKDEFVVPPSFLFAEDFSEGLAAVRKDYSSKVGFLDTQGRWAIPPKFGEAYSFSEGLAPASLEIDIRKEEIPPASFGYIDKKGEWKIPPQFFAAFPFQNGRAIVSILKKKEP